MLLWYFLNLRYFCLENYLMVHFFLVSGDYLYLKHLILYFLIIAYSLDIHYNNNNFYYSTQDLFSFSLKKAFLKIGKKFRHFKLITY